MPPDRPFLPPPCLVPAFRRHRPSSRLRLPSFIYVGNALPVSNTYQDYKSYCTMAMLSTLTRFVEQGLTNGKGLLAE